MTRLDIEATLRAAYIGMLAEGVAIALLICIAAAWIAMWSVAHG